MGVQAGDGGPGWSEGTGGCAGHHGSGPASFAAAFSVILGGNMQPSKNIETSKLSMGGQYTGAHAWDVRPDWSQGMVGCGGHHTCGCPSFAAAFCLTFAGNMQFHKHIENSR